MAEGSTRRMADDDPAQRYKPASTATLNGVHPHRPAPPYAGEASSLSSFSGSASFSGASSSNINSINNTPSKQFIQHTNTSTSDPSTSHQLQHRAIKIIPEDVELSSGMHRSRSSSVQLHLPPILSVSSPSGSSNGGVFNGMSPSGSRSTSPGGQLASSPASTLAPNGPSTSTSMGNPQFNLHLLPRVQEDDELNPPLRSPSMLKPFRPNPQLVRRRGGTVYIFAIIGGAFTLFILFIVLLSGSSTTLAGGGFSSRAGNLKRYGYAASATSTASLSRLSSYLGTYLPFLDQYHHSAALISLTSSAYLFGHTAEGVPTLHPILPLLQHAKTKAESLFSKQSTTLSQAVSQYRKRYKKDPPKGFDKWWSFAKARNHSLVDEYDSLMKDINIFSSLQPYVLKQRTRTLAQLPGISLITIKDGKAQIHSKSGKWAPALALQEMMNAFVSTLPDMEIAINEKHEGRVLPGKWREVKLDEWEDDDIPAELQKQQSELDHFLLFRYLLDEFPVGQCESPR